MQLHLLRLVFCAGFSTWRLLSCSNVAFVGARVPKLPNRFLVSRKLFVFALIHYFPNFTTSGQARRRHARDRRRRQRRADDPVGARRHRAVRQGGPAGVQLVRLLDRAVSLSVAPAARARPQLVRGAGKETYFTVLMSLLICDRFTLITSNVTRNLAVSLELPSLIKYTCLNVLVLCLSIPLRTSSADTAAPPS